MKIYICRHGQTTGDLEDRYGGSYDDHLTDLGRKQAEELAETLADSGIELIFSSPFFRARETAEYLGRKLNREIRIVDDLRERNKNGILTGMTRSEAKEKYPKMVEQLLDYRNQIEGAESQADFAKRIKKAFLNLWSEDYSRIGVVTHGGPIWTIFSDILGKKNLVEVADCGYFVLENDGKKIEIGEGKGIVFK